MGILSGMLRGAADVGAAGFMERFKADILAERDAALAGVRKGERAEEREFRASERIANQEFTAGRDTAAAISAGKEKTEKRAYEAERDKLRQTGREKVAKIRAGDKKDKPTIRTLTNPVTFEQELVEVITGDDGSLSFVPITKAGDGGFTEEDFGDADDYADKRVKELAGTFSTDKSDFADYGGSREKARLAFRNEYLGGGGTPDSVGESPEKDTTSVVLRHSKLGDITEEDITSTMAKHGLTRQQVLDKLGK